MSDDIGKISELAEQLVWKGPEPRVLSDERMEEYSALSQILQAQILASHNRGKLLLPNLSAFSNKTVAIFSDYSGESSGDYFTYSFLLCAWDLVGPFHEKMKALRENHCLGEKEIAFKDFRMGQLQRALPDYLNLLDVVPGFLFTLVVEKSIKSLFTTEDNAARQALAETLKSNGIGEWKVNTAEKLLRVVHISAMFEALLARPGQKIIWMSDDDEICPNEEKHTLVLRLYSQLLELYGRPTATLECPSSHDLEQLSI